MLRLSVFSTLALLCGSLFAAPPYTNYLDASYTNGTQYGVWSSCRSMVQV